METYQAVMLTRKGGVEGLETVELPMPLPGPGELRVKVIATGVGYTDIIMRRGYYPYAPKMPFVPGYETVGTVDALGEGVKGFALGDKVCALLVHGGYATHVVRGAEHWIKVPPDLDDSEVVALVLNYVTALQMIHRSAGMKPGESVLVTGASGGVGTALLELLRVHGVRAIGAASESKFEFVAGYGATPLDGRALHLDQDVRRVIAEGVDAAFDGIGGAMVGRCVRALKRGGRLVSYGFTGAVDSNLSLVRGVMALYLGARIKGRKPMFYGITQIYQKDRRPFREDLPKLFALLAERKIAPRIAETFPLLDARGANERLEKGGVEGKIVLRA